MPNIDLQPPHPLTSFRKLAMGAFAAPSDPTVYGALTLDVEEVLRELERYGAEHGTRVTLLQFTARALALGLREVPDANVVIVRGRPRRRCRVDIGLQVLLESEGEVDLTAVVVCDADALSLAQLAVTCAERVQQVRAGQASELERARRSFRSLPMCLTRPLVRLIHFLSHTLNLDLSLVRLPRDPFGSAMISNVGSLGLDEAYVPLMPHSGLPLQLGLGAVRTVPTVRDGHVVARRMVRISASFDHRLFDGVHAARLANVLRDCFAHPERVTGAGAPGPCAVRDGVRKVSEAC